MAAVREHNQNMVEALLLCEADPNLRDADGNTALHVAMSSQAPEVYIYIYICVCVCLCVCVCV